MDFPSTFWIANLRPLESVTFNGIRAVQEYLDVHESRQ